MSTVTAPVVANTDKIKGAISEVPEIRPGMTLKALMQTKTIRQRFEEVLGKKAAGFMSSVITAYSMNDYLQKCEPMSVISSAAIAAALDLPINSSLGFAHIVPYNNTATFQMGYKGFVQLAQRSGQYLTINVTEVYEGELVKSNRFSGLMEFDETKKTSDKIIGYVSYFKLMNGFEKWFYMTQEQMHAHAKKYSQSFAKGKGKWADDFVSMAKKTVLKLSLSKWGVLTIDMQKAITFDQAAVTKDNQPQYVDGSDTVTDAEVVHPEAKVESVDESLPKEVTLNTGEYEVVYGADGVQVSSGGNVYVSAHADTTKLIATAGKKSQSISILYWPGKGPLEIESAKAI